MTVWAIAWAGSSDFPWIRRTEELLATATRFEIIVDEPITTDPGRMTAKGRYLIIGSGGTTDPTSVMPIWLKSGGRPSQRQAWRKPWSNTTPVRLPSTATSTTTRSSARSTGGTTADATTELRQTGTGIAINSGDRRGPGTNAVGSLMAVTIPVDHI